MNIRDRLVLSAQPGKIALVREGLFLRCYQQSLFSLLRLQQEVKVLGRQFKNLEGQWVFYAGFPATQITKRLPDAREMAWGFEADCEDVSSDDYQDWFVAMTGDFEGRKKGSDPVMVQKGQEVAPLSSGRRVYFIPTSQKAKNDIYYPTSYIMWE